ncbi:hypothetical protein AB6A40_006608 [Gnathostoma spinigerum]|uniref:Uncharacterized protein n=1 Tax=Gnathostoma spinigerum TaxID=75299 RepID=A0ABD6EP18_9BILA
MTKGPPECAAKDQCSNVKDDFVCSYCQRSLPSIPFPIPLDKPLPIKFCLPKREDISSTEIRNIIKENGKKISKESCSARTNKPANDTLFRGLREKENEDGSRLSLNAANGSQMLNSDENNELLFRKLQSVNRKLSRQSTVQLTENYSGFFPEFLGTPAQPNVLETDDQSPSERKYREIIVKKARQANSVIPFVKIAYPDYVGPTAVCHQEIVKCEETNR